MKTKELIQKDDKTLNKLLVETKSKLIKDRFGVASRELANVSDIKKSKKLIAKINTILREREILARETKTNQKTVSKERK